MKKKKLLISNLRIQFKIFYPLHFPSEIKFRLHKICKKYPYSIAEEQFIKITIFKSPNQSKNFLPLMFPFILKTQNSIYRGQITFPWETPEPIFSGKRSFFPFSRYPAVSCLERHFIDRLTPWLVRSLIDGPSNGDWLMAVGVLLESLYHLDVWWLVRGFRREIHRLMFFSSSFFFLVQ